MRLELLWAIFWTAVTLLVWFILYVINIITPFLPKMDMISASAIVLSSLFVGVIGYVFPWMLPEEDYINMQWSFDHWRQGHNSQIIRHTLPFFLPTFTLQPQPRRTQVYVGRSRKQRKHATK